MIEKKSLLYHNYDDIIIKPLTAKLFNWNFYPLEGVSHRRDPHLQVSENYSNFTKWRLTIFKLLLIYVTLYLQLV